MSDSGENENRVLSPEELVEAKKLQALLRQKLATLLADSRTPEVFKDLFTDENLKLFGEKS